MADLNDKCVNSFQWRAITVPLSQVSLYFEFWNTLRTHVRIVAVNGQTTVSYYDGTWNFIRPSGEECVIQLRVRDVLFDWKFRKHSHLESRSCSGIDVISTREKQVERIFNWLGAAGRVRAEFHPNPVTLGLSRFVHAWYAGGTLGIQLCMHSCFGSRLNVCEDRCRRMSCLFFAFCSC